MHHAREIAAMDVDTLWSLPDGVMKVVFDDGVVETTTRATIYSAYMWGLYKRYPKTPALCAHHLGDRRVGSDTHMDLLGKVMWDCYDAYNGKLEVEELCRVIYQATNKIYNDFTYRLEASVKSLSILDFIEVIHHPLIRAANDAVEPTQRSIDATYSIIKKVLNDPRELINNPVANAAKNGLVSLGQINQCVGPRGYVTDVDSNIFREPILVGYVHGLRSLYDALIESRSASKALTFTEEPLQKTEYFNRRLQLLAASMEYIDMSDCGSKEYLKWRVRAGDLKHLAGKYYLTDKGLRRISDTEADRKLLVGEAIMMRSVLFCKHKHAAGVCATCFGDLALSVPKGTNIGHVSATALCEQASQRVLSVKHEDGSSSVDAIELSEYDLRFIRVGTDPNTLKLSDRLDRSRVIMVVESKQAEHLPDVFVVEDVKAMPVSNYSDLTEVQFTIISPRGKEEPVLIPVSVGSRHSSLSHELLHYVKQHGWSLTANGNYSIDLKDWDAELPLFVLPLKHMNMLDYMATIETFLKATGEGGTQKTLKDFTTTEAALAEFYTLVTSRLMVNIAHLEILVKVATIRSDDAKDYRIPLWNQVPQFGKFSQIMGHRSLSAAMAYEQQKRVLNDPSAYLVENRPNHILDALLIG